MLAEPTKGGIIADDDTTGAQFIPSTIMATSDHNKAVANEALQSSADVPAIQPAIIISALM